ncbi:MAG: pyridoxamine 5-phosphate oxidase [Blastococcus sp.]|nr:pyridoxamine 5-phosphate oxidase [Blastococcus sp.]
MSDEDSWAFLREPRIGVLSVNRAGHAPHASPIWFLVEDDGIEFTVSSASVKASVLREPTLASLTVHSDAWPYRYVTLDGRARVVRERTTDDLRLFAGRYLGDLLKDAYVDSVKHGGVIIRLDVAKITDVDFR